MINTAETEKLLAFFNECDEKGITNLEKTKNAKVIRRVATTDQSKSYEDGTADTDDELPLGIVDKNDKIIGLGIHIFNDDIYPLQSFEIYLRGIDLTGHLDLTESRDMIFLDLYNNRITSVDIDEMPAMRILGLQNNQIESLNVKNLPICQGIDIGRNKLKALDVSHNSELAELYINDNELTEIDLSHNPKLKYFYCHNNRIPTLDTRKNPFLRHLNATGNPMTEIYSLAPQRETQLPLTLKAVYGGYVGLKFNPIYNAQWKETGEWEQSYHAAPWDGFSFAGWYDENGVLLSDKALCIDKYGKSRVLTARFKSESIID